MICPEVWSLVQVPVVLQPSAWWQHAIGAVLSERRDLLQQEAKPKLNAQEQWRVRQQYTAAYLGMQKERHSAAHRLGFKAWSGLDLLEVWAFADIPYLPGDLLIHLVKVAISIHKQGRCLLRVLLAAFVVRRFGQQCRVRRPLCHTCCRCDAMSHLYCLQYCQNRRRSCRCRPVREDYTPTANARVLRRDWRHR